MTWIDLRSDTVTQPTPEMRQAMADAEVGDDVFGEDPTVNRLEATLVDMFGMEAGLYCSSGTMTNQIAIKSHTQPGDEVICDRLAHIYHYEGGGIAFNSGASVRLLSGDKGRFTADMVEENINPEDGHHPVSSLASIENTCNKGGGTVWDFNEIQMIRSVCDHYELKFHLDGARLFNALTETRQSPKDYGRVFDSISICLSKGLGAPVGSVLLGSKDFIRQARRIRKVMGGGMRQAGIIAAAGLYALEHHIDRLQDDHRRARILTEYLERQSYVESVQPVETNLIMIAFDPIVNLNHFQQHMAANRIRVMDMDPHTMRWVTHLDIDDTDVERIQSALETYHPDE